MKICILGWYGTETLGDRAILDGLIQVFEQKESGNTYYLGSIIPFFSEHTIILDHDCYSSKKIDIEIFCEKNETELKRYILLSDYVIMGGGPLMDISELLIIRKGFKLARKASIKTGLIGCGYGPFHDMFYSSVAEDILKLSDVIILRDLISSQRAGMVDNSVKAITLSDPAVISALSYKERTQINRENFISINFRDSRFKVYKDEITSYIDDLYLLIKKFADSFPKIVLVPMHTFFWGGDDRAFFVELLYNHKIENVFVKYEQQSLYDLYGCFSNAFGCVGMRYHSVVLQTILNGNNIILDYTEAKTGKISGFLEELDSDFYSNRYINIDNFYGHDISGYISTIKANERYDYKLNYMDLIEKYIGVMF